MMAVRVGVVSDLHDQGPRCRRRGGDDVDLSAGFDKNPVMIGGVKMEAIDC